MSTVQNVQDPINFGVIRSGPDHILSLKIISEQAGQPGPVAQCTALLDVGSSVNTISESKVVSLGLYDKILLSRHSYLASISGKINIVGEVVLSFSTESGPTGREPSYQSTFIVVPDRATPSSDIILGRDFIDQSLTKPLVSGKIPPGNFLKDKSSEQVGLDGHKSWLLSRVHGLEIAGPADHSRAHDADILFLISQEWSDKSDWPLKFLPLDLPSVRVMRLNRHRIAKSLPPEPIWKSVGSCRPLFDALLREQESNSAIEHIPLIVVCDAIGRLVLQKILDDLDFALEFSNLDRTTKAAHSPRLQQRLQAVIVFDFGRSRDLHKALKPSRVLSNCPVTYFRPARSIFLKTAKELVQRSIPVETDAAVLYLDVKSKNFMQYSKRNNPNYRLLLQLLRASYNPSSTISDEKRNKEVGSSTDLSPINTLRGNRVYANSANVINASEDAVVIAYSANIINSSGPVYVSQAGVVNAEGRAIVNAQDCGVVDSNERATIFISNARNVNGNDRTILNTGGAADFKASDQAILNVRDPSVDPVLMPENIQATIDKEPSKRSDATAHQRTDVDTQQLPQPSSISDGILTAELASKIPLELSTEARIQLLNLRSQSQKLLDHLHANDQTEALNKSAKIMFQWEIMKFLQEDFEPDQNLEHIFVLVGTPTHPAGMTCGEYMSITWPNMGFFVLNTIQKAFTELVKRPLSEKTYSCQEPTSCPGLTISEFQWSCKNEVEPVSFQIQGETQLVLDFMESIAWLAAALRLTNRKYPGISVSDIFGSVSINHQDTNAVSIKLHGWLWPMREIKSNPEPCWHNLFKSPTIVDCYYSREGVGRTSKIVESHSGGYGIRLTLRDMTALSGAEILMEYEGGMVYFGYNTILVPIKKLHNGCLQWHLKSQSKSKKMMSLASIDDDEICKGRDRSIDEAAIVDAEVHYLGLWTEALMALGTADARNYANLRHRAYAADTKVQISESNNAGIGLNLMTGAPNLAAGKSVTYAKSQTNMDYNYKKKVFLDILGDFKGQLALIFETNPERQRAWLVPKLSLVLHAAHYFFLSQKWGRNCLLNHAERAADGNTAAWEVLEPDDQWDSVRGLKPESTPGDKKELEKLLTRIVSNMIKMDAKLVSQGPISRVHGYNLAKLPSDPKFRPVHTGFRFLKSRQGWWLLTKHVPLYLVDSMSPPILPADQLWEFAFDTLPKNHLICPMICLSTLNANEGEFPTTSKVSNHLHLHSPHEPFDQCTCTLCGRGGIDLDMTWRTLCLTRKSDGLRKWERMSDHATAAILISSRGRIFHKSPSRNDAYGDPIIQHEQAEHNEEVIADDISHSENEEEVFYDVIESSGEDSGEDVIESPDEDAGVNTEGASIVDNGQPGPSFRQRVTTNDLLLGHVVGSERMDLLPTLLSKLPSETGNMAILNGHNNPLESKRDGKQPARDNDRSEVFDNARAPNQSSKVLNVNNNTPTADASRGVSVLHRVGSSVRKGFSKIRSKHKLKVETAE